MDGEQVRYELGLAKLAADGDCGAWLLLWQKRASRARRMWHGPRSTRSCRARRHNMLTAKEIRDAIVEYNAGGLELTFEICKERDDMARLEVSMCKPVECTVSIEYDLDSTGYVYVGMFLTYTPEDAIAFPHEDKESVALFVLGCFHRIISEHYLGIAYILKQYR